MRSNKTSSTNKPVTTDERQSRQDVNQVTLIGRLVAAPMLRETGSGKHVITARIAVSSKSRTEFFDLVLWGQLADFATTYLGKGRLIYQQRLAKSDSPSTWKVAPSIRSTGFLCCPLTSISLGRSSKRRRARRGPDVRRWR